MERASEACYTQTLSVGESWCKRDATVKNLPGKTAVAMLTSAPTRAGKSFRLGSSGPAVLKSYTKSASSGKSAYRSAALWNISVRIREC